MTDKAKFGLESELILNCSETAASSQRTERILQILEKPLDWKYILHTAGRNGVLPLLSWNLLRSFPDSVPDEILSQLSALRQTQTFRNLFLTRKLIEIVETLAAEHIPVLPFKGTTLAQQAYGDLSLRQYCDLDILVQPKHFDKAVALFCSIGYTPLSTTSWLQKKGLFFTRKKDVVLVSSDGQVRVELHWKLSGSHFALPVEINQLWDRLETVNIGGYDLLALPFHDLIVYLCLHGSRHGWERLCWVSDLHELILTTEKSGANIDWGMVRSHAKELGCEKILDLGLFLTNYFFDFETGYPCNNRINNDESFRKIAEKVKSKIFAKIASGDQIGEWYLYHLALKERRSDRFRLHIVYLLWYAKLAFRPNALDQAVFHLPSLFYPLYYILRPIRLILTYLKLGGKEHPSK